MTAPNSNLPTRRDKLRPVEYLAISAIIAIFIGVVVALSTRQVNLALIFAVISFIVSLVGIAMLALAVKPGDSESIEMTEQRDTSDNGH